MASYFQLASIALAVLIMGAIAVIHYVQYLKPPSRGKRIPGPPQLPLLGNFLQLSPHRVNVTKIFQPWTETYGRIFKFHMVQLGAHPALLVADPAILKHILVTGFQDGRYGKGDTFSQQYFELFGNGIFNSNGQQWFHHREFAKPHFTPQALRGTVQVFEKYANRLSSHLEMKGLRNVDMQDWFMRYTLASFGEAGLGAQLGAIEQEVNLFAIAFDYVQTKSAERGNIGELWKLLPKDKVFEKQIAYLNGYCKDVMSARLREPKEQLEQRTDLLSKILAASSADGKALVEEEIVDFLKNFLIAGRDTTAELLTWCVFLLSKHPAVEAAVLNEITTIVGDKPLTMELINQLRYLKCVLQEVLRLYPPVPINLLTALSDDMLPGDYFVKKDTIILYSAYIIHRIPEFWPNPEQFNPDRWLGEPPKPFTYLPFHGGPRLCLGMDMAFLEARVALVVLLRKWKFVPVAGFEPSLKVKIILTSENGMMMNLEPRT